MGHCPDPVHNRLHQRVRLPLASTRKCKQSRRFCRPMPTSGLNPSAPTPYRTGGPRPTPVPVPHQVFLVYLQPQNVCFDSSDDAKLCDWAYYHLLHVLPCTLVPTGPSSLYMDRRGGWTDSGGRSARWHPRPFRLYRWADQQYNDLPSANQFPSLSLTTLALCPDGFPPFLALSVCCWACRETPSLTNSHSGF